MTEHTTPYCCGRPDCAWEAPEVKQAEDLVREWIEEYGHEDTLLADKWPLIGRISYALHCAKMGKP